MKPTRIFATASLIISSVALITAASISAGDEPGVVRMASSSPLDGTAPVPTPDPVGTIGDATVNRPPDSSGLYPQPGQYAPYFERSFGATESVPSAYFQPQQPFGPILMFESNINKGLGYNDGYQRFNARVPYHIVPDTTVLIGDVSASVTYDGTPLGNAGVIYRNFDSLQNRIFGWNAYADYDQGYTDNEWYRTGVGFESLGRYIDFRSNGYAVVGDNSALLSSQLVGNLLLSGNNVFRLRNELRENAYSGVDAEVGGPLPILGKYGQNLYAGAYFLTNNHGSDTVGFQARWQALITQNLTANTYFTTDDTFGVNSWVGLQYEIPNYKSRRTLRPACVRERLQDPVYRNNRIATHIDLETNPEAMLNCDTGIAYNILYVDPNASAAGTGTFDNPFNTMAAAKAANSGAVDVIRVTPRDDDSGTNLTIFGGMSLFDDQALISSNSDYELFRDGTTPFFIPGTGSTNPGPLLTNPNITAGDSIIRLANNNTIVGMRFDASNAAGTVFGNGVSNPLPITNVNLTDNTFTNYIIGADLQDVSGRVIVDGNTFTGRPVTATIRSTYGLRMSVAASSSADLLLTNNVATNNQVAGLSVTANAGSTLNADDPDGIPPGLPPANCFIFLTTNTGITNNVTTGNGNGIEVIGNPGSTINAVVDDNTSTNNTRNGFFGRTDGGEFNLSSMRSNTFSNNDENGAFLHYRNGGVFKSVSEDLTEDLNLNGILDPGEDTDGDGVLDLTNGVLDAFEDSNGNGRLDEAIVLNSFNGNTIAGLCILGEDAANAGSMGMFDVGSGLGAVGAAGSGNDFLRNGTAGIAYDLTGFATGQIDAVNNNILGVARSLSFLIDGDTFLNPWLLTNTSASSVDITRLTIDILPSGNIWDTTDVDPGISFVSFQPRLNSDVTTGLTSVNGTSITAGTNPLTDANGVVLLDGGVADGTGLLDLTFNDFGSQEVFTWDLDVDPIGFPDGTTTGDQLIGSTIQLQFSDGGTLAGTLQAVAGNPLAAEFVATEGTGAAHGIAIRGADNAVLEASTILNNVIDGNGRWGVDVSMSDAARAESLDVKANTVTNNGAGGVRLHADGPAAFIDASIGGVGTLQLAAGNVVNAANQFSRNQGDGFRALAENGGMINGNLINNTIENNRGDGAALIIDNGGTLNFGNLAENQVISRNTIRTNTGAGLRLVSNASPSTVAELNAIVQGNTISGNLGGGIVAEVNGANNNPPAPPLNNPNNTLNLTINDSAYVDLTPGQNRNFISGNGDVGIGVNVGGNGLANVTLDNVSVTGTFDGPDPLRNGDGIALTRSGASLLTATLNSVDVTGNAGDGLDVEAQGNDKSDPNQPFSGTPNMVTVTDSNFSFNGGNGARFRTRGDATLIGDVSQSTFNNNGENGILVHTSDGSSFGDPTIGLPPGRRSRFDGNTINNNGIDGVQIIATDNSRALVEITSNAAAATPGPHAAGSALGSTSISNNGRDGVHITTTGGRSDILITSGTATTTIDGNGTVAGGNGVRWDASGTSDGIVRVTRTTITNSIAGATEDANGNGVLDAGEDLNGNGDIDVADGDGIQANFSNDATATLIVGNVGDGNIIQTNEDDGIAITATGSNASGNPRPVITITDNTIGGTDDGLNAGNAGDGVSMNVIGGTAVGIPPAAVDFTQPGLSPNDGVTESGAVPQFTMSNNLVSNNGQRGVNVLLNGASGTRDRENGNAFFDPVLITLTDNTIVSNGAEGIFYRADADMNQSRFVYLPNFPDPPVANNDNQDWNPFRSEFFAMNVGSVNGNTAYLAPYLNLRTVQNSFLTVTGNTIQNNGVNTVTGEGLRIDVGTGAYVAADIQNNTFGGNLEEDLVTSSFLSAGNTFDSVDTAGDQTFDYVYLDDTAQLDMRFQNNSGNQIAPSDVGAFYTNPDPLKTQFFGPVGVQNRDASLFQVDNGPALNNPNNTFINFGITQDIQAAFTAGNYNLRGFADPLFPNIGFPPYLP